MCFGGSLVATDIKGSTARIFRSSDHLQVVRVDATADAALVVDYQPVGDGPHEGFIRKPVRTPGPDTLFKLPVSFVVVIARPKPAAAVWLRAYPCKKPRN
jgi:hypothetical protein